jgi:hypothetical protein
MDLLEYINNNVQEINKMGIWLQIEKVTHKEMTDDMIEIFRNVMLNIPQQHILQDLAYSGAWMLVLLTIGIRMFSRVERSFMDTV